MAVAYDSASATGPTASVSSVNWAHTLGAGTKLVAIVSIGAAGGTLRTVSSVTYGAQNMTQVPSSRITNADPAFHELWYLIAPSGNQTVTVTLSGAQSSMCAGIIVVSGADQTAPLNTAATTSGIAATFTLSGIVSDTPELVVGGGFNDFNSATAWAISTGTSRFTVGSGSSATGLVGATAAGVNPSTSLAWTESGGSNNSPKLASAVSIKVDTGGGYTPPPVFPGVFNLDARRMI